jgi:hypothetical protein
MSLVFNTWVPTTGCGSMPLSLTNFMELLVITIANTIPPVTNVPAGGLFILFINGVSFTPDDGSFTLNGKNITWTSTILAVQPGDTVVAVYSYMGPSA